jgi:hypothetical protein
MDDRRAQGALFVRLLKQANDAFGADALKCASEPAHDPEHDHFYLERPGCDR